MKELEKRCFKCGRLLPLSEFYKHKRMADGHLNKCKECTKNDTSKNYSKKSQDEMWMEKERARSREKYHRLGYYKKGYGGNMTTLNKIEGTTRFRFIRKPYRNKG